jgi:hypothetical protein
MDIRKPTGDGLEAIKEHETAFPEKGFAAIGFAGRPRPANAATEAESEHWIATDMCP